MIEKEVEAQSELQNDVTIRKHIIHLYVLRFTQTKEDLDSKGVLETTFNYIRNNCKVFSFLHVNNSVTFDQKDPLFAILNQKIADYAAHSLLKDFQEK